jgi:hypothetical protein
MAQAFALTDRVVHVDGVGVLPTSERALLLADRSSVRALVSGYLLSAFSYDAPWAYQERHPDGDEVAIVVEGEIDLLLQQPGEPAETAVRVGCGETTIVPTGAWHRVAPCAPATIVFLTPVPARTEHRPVATEP